jgi:hypothetical protein
VLGVVRSDESLIVQCVAGIAAFRGHSHVAAGLMGFVDALVEREASRRDSLQQRSWDDLCSSVAKQLQPSVIALRRAEGRTLSAQNRRQRSNSFAE